MAARVTGGALAKTRRKKKMRRFGKVGIPQEAFIAALKVDS